MIRTVTLNNQTTPGGTLEVGEAKYALKVPAEITTPDEIDRLVVATRDGIPIYLSDVAVARDTYKDRTSFSRVNGIEAVSIKVTKRSGEHLLRIADDVKEIVDALRD